MPIHPTAVVDSSAEIDPSADIGAYAIVEPGCRIGADVQLLPHAYVATGTTLEAGCIIHPFAVVGHWPQDLKWAGEPSYTVVGAGTVVREHASIHRGTIPGSTTVVGRECYLMSTAHIGHNCEVGNNVIMVNGALLSGHVEVGDHAFIAGMAGVHQFARIGERAMLAGATGISKDVPPFMLVARPTYVAGTNVVGLRRAGFSTEERAELRAAYRTLYRGGLHFPEAITQVAEMVRTEPGRRLVAFLQAPSKRGFQAGPRGSRPNAGSDAEL